MQTQIAEFIAVPTTSGTGSEVTNFSVITVAETGTKIPLVTDEIQPEIAILDTNLVMSVHQNHSGYRNGRLNACY